MKKRNDPVCEAKLLRKFGGLNFYDPDTKATYKVHTEHMHWEKYHGQTQRSGGAVLVGLALRYDQGS